MVFLLSKGNNYIFPLISSFLLLSKYLPRQYKKTLDAIRIGKYLNPNDVIYIYSDFAIYHLIDYINISKRCCC